MREDGVSLRDTAWRIAISLGIVGAIFLVIWLVAM